MTSLEVVVAIAGSGLSRAIADDLVDQCAAAGASRVQINISDEPVSQAMRINELDPTLQAVVTFWAPQASQLLAALAEDIDGVIGAWEVEARTPLVTELPADGTRIDGLSNIAFLRRPAELDHDEWLQRWLGDHTHVAIDTQATFGYVQNVVIRPLLNGTPRVDGIVEELFPMAAVSDIHAFYGSDGDKGELDRRMTLMLNSVARFGADRNLDVVPTSRYDFDLTRGA